MACPIAGPIALPGGRLVWLATQAECEAFRVMFPGTPRGLLEVDLMAALERIRADRAEDVWRPMRLTEGRGPTRQRAFVWVDAWGRHQAREWIDPAPLHYRDLPADWPKYPSPTTAAQRHEGVR